MPVLYLRGISAGDFQEALAALLGKDAPNLSAAVIGRLKSEWEDEYRQWQKRDLSARHYVYVWADGVYLQARMEPQAECMLVLMGATAEGKKELIGLQTGMRESGQSWKELLVDLKARGLVVAPQVAIGDGALGFWKALDEAFPATVTNDAGCTDIERTRQVPEATARLREQRGSGERADNFSVSGLWESLQCLRAYEAEAAELQDVTRHDGVVRSLANSNEVELAHHHVKLLHLAAHVGQ